MLKRIPFYKIVVPVLAVNLLLVLLVILMQRSLPPVIPLFYGQPAGERELAKSIWPMIPAVVSLVLVVINVGLTKLVGDNFLQRALVGAIVAVTTLSTITIIKIMFLVGNLPI